MTDFFDAKNIPRIVIVEDEKDVAEIYQLHFDSFKFEVHTAFDGNDGFTKILNINPDLIIADLHMPQMRGDEMLMELMKMKAKQPIMFITGTQNEDEIVNLYNHNAFAVVAKPVSPQMIIALALNALRFEWSRLTLAGQCKQLYDKLQQNHGPSELSDYIYELRKHGQIRK